MDRRGFLKFFGAGTAALLTDTSALANGLADMDKHTRWKILQKEFVHLRMDITNAQTPYMNVYDFLNIPHTKASIAEELSSLAQHPSNQLAEMKEGMRELRSLYRKYVDPKDADAFAQMAQREANAVLNTHGMPSARSTIMDELKPLRMNDAEFAAWEKENFASVLKTKARLEQKREQLEKQQHELEVGKSPKPVAYRQITHKHGDERYWIDVERSYVRGKWEPKSSWLNRAKKHAADLEQCFGNDATLHAEATAGRVRLDVVKGSKAEHYLQSRMRQQIERPGRE